jgi:ubiquinone/menaquinone biosynthesis C-methylase UbiE
MKASNSGSEYVLGYTDAEHVRLARQAELVGPSTERLFRMAGIGPGQRVLDLGSGAGDVSMLLAKLVGPSGEVVGVERDPHSIARATARVAAAGLANVSFTQSDASQIPAGKPFDAAVGRFILMFVPDPVAVVRSLSGLVRPGGVIAFQEPSWAAFFPLVSHLPLTRASAQLVHDALKAGGGNTEMGLALYRVFQDAGLPEPSMHLEMPIWNQDTVDWIVDILRTLRPQIATTSLQAIGDADDLQTRLRDEVAASKGVLPWIGAVGVWSTKPATVASH